MDRTSELCPYILCNSFILILFHLQLNKKAPFRFTLFIFTFSNLDPLKLHFTKLPPAIDVFLILIFLKIY